MCCVVSDDCTDNSKDVLHQFLLSLTKNFSASRHEICDGKVDVCTQVSQVVLQQRTRVAVDLISFMFVSWTGISACTRYGGGSTNKHVGTTVRQHCDAHDRPRCNVLPRLIGFAGKRNICT